MSRAARHQAAEFAIQLRRAAGDVERRDAPLLKECEHVSALAGVHLLGAFGPRIDVAVHAGLVAA